MLQEDTEREDESGDINTVINSHEYYTAIKNEDLGCIEDMSKKYGPDFPIKIKDKTPGKFFWKGRVILPLHLAALNRRAQSMRSLLSAGADPEMRDQLGRTTLHLLISAWPSIPKTQLEPGSKFQTTVTNVHRQAEACLRLLCEHGVDINAKVVGQRQQTALHLTVSSRAVSAIQMLSSCGADVNAVDGGGLTPLHMASGMLHKDMMASLIRQGADINKVVQHSGNTPLHLAVVAINMKTGKTLEDKFSCISELLEHSEELDVVNRAGMTPLQEACSMGNSEVVDMLLRYGANINKLSKSGENCLFLFLSHKQNIRNSCLLWKLLSLTSPLTLYSQDGRLPSALTLPCFSKQREQLLELTQQPRTLQHICQSHIYLKLIRVEREKLRKILPERLYDFMFSYWENTKDVFFLTEGETD